MISTHNYECYHGSMFAEYTYQFIIEHGFLKNYNYSVSQFYTSFQKIYAGKLAHISHNFI